MHTIDDLLDGTVDTGDAARAMLEDPVSFFDASCTKMHSVPRDVLEELQTEALTQRFDDRRGRIAMLQKLADRQGIDSVERIDDVVPLLFEHTIYKSHPSLLLEQSRFDELTTWLDRLTAHDLSQVDATGCTSIHEWMDLLQAETELDRITSSGTTGTMSFVPRDRSDWR